MCVCVYVCAYIQLCAHTYNCVRAHMYVYIHVCLCVCLCTCVFVCVLGNTIVVAIGITIGLVYFSCFVYSSSVAVTDETILYFVSLTVLTYSVTLKAICSQLETLEKRAIIYNFVL